MRDEFTTFDIINKLGIPRGRLREWVNEGFIVPSVQKAEGVGTKALFDRVDIIALVIFKHLIEAHKISRSEAALIVNEWVHVIHIFKNAADEKIFQDFFDTCPYFQVIRQHGKTFVAPVVAHDIFFKHIEGGSRLATKFRQALGEKAFDNACRMASLKSDIRFDEIKPLAKVSVRLRGARVGDANPMIEVIDKDTDEILSKPFAEYDSILQVNFRKVMEEAKKVFD
jgi:hypothetical protein